MAVRLKPSRGDAPDRHDTEKTIDRFSRASLVEVAGLPDPATNRGLLIQVTDESGGEVPAFSDGTNWRRVTDRAVVS